MRSENRHEYLAVDLLRGIAALSVIVWHYQCLYALAPGQPPLFHSPKDQPLYWLLYLFYDYGACAVQMFWAISGFVFAATYIRRQQSAKHFFVARFARLYPLHFVTLLAVAVIQIFSVHKFGRVQIGGEDDVYHFVLNLFFASAWGFERGFSYNNPIWSVSVEVVIYLAFFLSIPSVARFRFIVPALLMLCFHQFLSHGVPGPFWQCGYFFFGGVLLFSAVDRLGRWSILLGTVMIATWLYKGYGIIDATLWYAFPLLFAGTLVCVASIDKFKITRPITSRVAWIGESTYSTYLLHMPIMMLILFFFDSTGIDQVSVVGHVRFFAPYIIAVFGLARLSYLYFERPVGRAIREYFLSPPAPRYPAVAASPE